MDTANDLRLRQDQQVVVTLLIAAMIVEAFAVVMAGFQAMSLDHGTHCAVENEDALAQLTIQQIGAIFSHAFARK